jgi:hypothetical protein
MRFSSFKRIASLLRTERFPQAPRCFRHKHPVFCKRVGNSRVDGRLVQRFICPKCLCIHFKRKGGLR